MAKTISAAQAGTIKVGDLTVHRIGLGTNRLHDTADGHALLKHAIELGVNFIDTAHTYAGGDSEIAIGNALSPYESGTIIATKGGMGNGASPKQLRAELEESLRRLKIDQIGLYQLHRVDPNMPIAETMRVFKQFQQEGLIRNVGLSEVSVTQIKEAEAVLPIASVQNQYNVVTRTYEDVVEYCTEHDIAFIPWFPLGGLAGEGAEVEAMVGDIAAVHEATPQHIALAWLLKRSPMMLPIPGTTSPAHLEDNLKAAAIKLSDQEYQSLLTQHS